MICWLLLLSVSSCLFQVVTVNYVGKGNMAFAEGNAVLTHLFQQELMSLLQVPPL